MTCQHTGCKGPECTLAAVPKRPPIGLARERLELMTALQTALKDLLPTAKAYSVSASSYYLQSAVAALHNAHNVLRLHADKWDYKTVLTSINVKHIVTIQVKRRKE